MIIYKLEFGTLVYDLNRILKVAGVCERCEKQEVSLNYKAGQRLKPHGVGEIKVVNGMRAVKYDKKVRLNQIKKQREMIGPR